MRLPAGLHLSLTLSQGPDCGKVTNAAQDTAPETFLTAVAMLPDAQQVRESH